MIKEVIGDCTLYNADCRDVLPLLDRVDAVITDPPYGIGESNEKNASRDNAAKTTDYGHYEWDYEKVEGEFIDRIRTISKHQIIFGGNYYHLPPTSCWLVWDKLNGKNDFADCELAWTNLPKAVRKYQHLWNGMIRKDREKRYHPTQKPRAVMEWAIGQLPDTAHTILDPFMGSGTTGVACVRLGRKFIGIELDPKWFDVACERIRRELNQGDLFRSNND